MKFRATMIGVALLLAGVVLSASGPVGIYGIIEKVVFEPNEQAPERLQVWGAFAYVDGAAGGLGISPAKRGYLYFRVPEISPALNIVRTEWADLKSVAGTGQAVGFGRWTYIAAFSALRPDTRPVAPSIIVAPAGGAGVDLRVRPDSEPLANPVEYMRNAGVVKIAEASHGAVIKALKDAK